MPARKGFVALAKRSLSVVTPGEYDGFASHLSCARVLAVG